MKYNKIIQEWKNKNIDSLASLEMALNGFRVIFAYNSGVIENPEITYHNTREIFENEKLVNYTGDLRTVFEMQNQKICYDFLKEKIINREPLSSELIKEIHKKLTAGTYDNRRWELGERPGEFKKIEELCEEVKQVSDKGENIIKAAAYIHCKFENTHPFADGNGRVGRTIMNYYLMIHNYPPLVVYNETKDKYYIALGHYDETGDIDLFKEYMIESLEQYWQKRRAPENKLDNFI